MYHERILSLLDKMAFLEACPLSPRFTSNDRSHSIFSTDTDLHQKHQNIMIHITSGWYFSTVSSPSPIMVLLFVFLLFVFHHDGIQYHWCSFHHQLYSSLHKLVPFDSDQVFTVAAYMNEIIVLSWGHVQSLRCGIVSFFTSQYNFEWWCHYENLHSISIISTSTLTGTSDFH